MIEAKIGRGQIEELVNHAKCEISLIPEMAEWKPWIFPPGKTITMRTDDLSLKETCLFAAAQAAKLPQAATPASLPPPSKP